MGYFKLYVRGVGDNCEDSNHTLLVSLVASDRHRGENHNHHCDLRGDNTTNSSCHKGSQRQTQADATEPDEASSSHWQWRNSVNTKRAPLYHLTFIFVSFIYIDQVHCNHLKKK